jgi:hypothetical protein
MCPWCWIQTEGETPEPRRRASCMPQAQCDDKDRLLGVLCHPRGRDNLVTTVAPFQAPTP